MLNVLVSKIYKALFLRGEDIEAKRVHIIVKFMFLIIGLVSIYMGHYITSIFSILVIFLLSLYYGLKSEYISSIIIASIPALWLALTNFIVVFLLKSIIDVNAILIVFIKVISATLIILWFMFILTPIELYNIIIKLRRGNPVYPLLTWRLIPLGLREVEESYIIQRMKNEPIWKSLAISTASMIERGDKIIEANIHKLSIKLNKPLPYKYLLKPTLIFITVTFSTATISILEYLNLI